MADAALQAAFQFTDDDLVANRAGRLSPTQQARMSVAKGRSQVANVIFGAIFLVIIVVIAVVVLPPLLAPRPANSSAVPPGIIVLVLVVVVGIIALTIFRSRRKLNRLDGAVHMTEGPAKTRRGTTGAVDDMVAMNVYRLTVGSVTFPLSTAAQLAPFTDGQRYKVYYVKGTLPIPVSAEAV
jgi:membrane protein implicated in regulation of membrane protease activity